MNDKLKKWIFILFILLFLASLIDQGAFIRWVILGEADNQKFVPAKNEIQYLSTDKSWSFYYPKNLILEKKEETGVTKIYFSQGENLKLLLERYDLRKNMNPFCQHLNLTAEIPIWLINCGSSKRVLEIVQEQEKGERNIVYLQGFSPQIDHLEPLLISSNQILYIIYPIPVKKDIYAATPIKELAERIIRSIRE